MIQAKCIKKFRDKNNHIYGYCLVDLNGRTQDVKPENLKKAIAKNQINVTNLTLTSDGRLVDRQDDTFKNIKLGDAPTRKTSSKGNIVSSIASMIENRTNTKLKEFEHNNTLGNRSIDIKYKIGDRTDIILEIEYEGSSRMLWIVLEIDEDTTLLELNSDASSKEQVPIIIDKIVNVINKTEKLRNTGDASILLDVASILVQNTHEESEEAVIEPIISTLEKMYNTDASEEIQNRIDKLSCKKDEIKRIIKVLYDNKRYIYNEYNLDMSDEDTLQRYVKGSVYYEALTLVKVKDFTQPYLMLNNQTHMKEYEFHIYLGIKHD